MNRFIKTIFCLSILLVLFSCDSLNVYQRTEDNYGAELERLASEYDLPVEYLKALIILECSGKKPAPSRMENGVLIKLKEVRDGQRSQLEHIRQHTLSNCSDAALENLASSWGPFQLMGYKCIHMGILVKDIRGDDALRWGVKWINAEYGNYLKEGRFEEAFRIHNTGAPHGRTFDPDYVSNGMEYINYFKNNPRTE